MTTLTEDERRAALEAYGKYAMVPKRDDERILPFPESQQMWLAAWAACKEQYANAGFCRVMEKQRNQALDIYSKAVTQLNQARRERDALLVELQIIANATTITWDEPNEFRAWAQNRARHVIESIKPNPGEAT